MPIHAYRDHRPQLGARVFLAPTAHLAGRVEVGDDSSFWFSTAARGDVNWIRLGARTSVQDGTVLHVSHETHPLVIGDDVVIGHSAMIHGCSLESACLIGIGARVLDGAVIESGAMVAAGALVAPGRYTVTLAKKVDGAITELGAPQPFEVVRLREGTLPGATPALVDEFMAARAEALANRLPVPPFAAAQGFASGASPAWRISVKATLPDGVTFARDAVFRPMSDPRRPFVTLLWQEGPSGPRSEPQSPDGTPAQENGSGKP